MIAIKMRGDKFRLEVREEEFEFANREEMQKILTNILDLKDKCGKLNRE